MLNLSNFQMLENHPRFMLSYCSAILVDFSSNRKKNPYLMITRVHVNLMLLNLVLKCVNFVLTTK